MAAPPHRPLPEPDALTAPFWAHADHGILAIQRCSACGFYYHPPVAVCFDCLESELVFEPVSGRGTVYAVTMTHDARHPAFQAMQPYAVVVVEIEEQPGLFLLSNMPGTALDEILVGAAVEARFEDVEGGHVLPQFRLAGSGK